MNVCDLITCILPLLVLASLPSQAASPMALVKSGKPTATIVLGPDATAPERFAATQLADTIEQISGARLKIADTAPSAGTRIFVGQTAVVKRLLKGFNWEQLRRDGILIRTTVRDLILAGDRPRGSIYAVQELLETKLGVRWYAPDAQRIPKAKTITVPAMNVCYTPKLMYREAYFHNVMQKDALFPVHMRMNGHHQQIKPEMGGHYNLLGFVHTFDQMLPAAKYYAQHPEWYSLINGKRDGGYTQMCLTNEDMKREMVKVALDTIRKQPDAGMISISQNDNMSPCQCDKCKALVKKTGSESGALIIFVNDVAAEIEKQYPDFLVETLAYQYTRHAPTNIKPRDNVIVRLCSIENDFGKPITAAENKSFYKDLTDWKKIAKRLYVWNYVVDFASYLIPHPNFSILGPDLRSFTENNVVGMFEQGDSFNVDSTMYPLKIYLLSKLMWNPNQPELPIMKEFMDGYYGPAGKPLLEAVLGMESARKRSGVRLSCYIGNADYFSCDELTKFKRLYDQAEAAVKNNPTLLKRVQIQRLALDLVLINTKRNLALAHQEVPGVNWDTIVDHFVDFSNQTSNNWPSEGRKWDEGFRTQLKAKMAPPPTYPKAQSAMGVSGVQGVDWLDAQEGDFNLAEEGNWVNIVKDPEASNGYAAEMPCSHTQWAVQHLIYEGEVKWPKVDVSLELKVIPAEGQAGKPTDGVLLFGVYNKFTNETLTNVLTMADIKPGYQQMVYKEISLKPGMYLFTAPIVNPSIKAVRIDRFTIQAAR
ncbi:MAG: DUF4838 domain-containing protein [Armatimonadota bacterium]